MYSFGSFSDMIFLFWVCVILFSNEYVLHILCWCVLRFWFETYFHLCIMITLVWPIMEDIEPIWPRIRRSTHFTFWLEQYHIHIHTLTLWTWWPTHFEPDMTPSLDTITRLYYPCSPYHAIVPLPILSIISWVWPGSVWDGLTRGELYMMIDGSWWESGLTAWWCCWGRWIVMEHPDLRHCTWLQRVRTTRDGDLMRRWWVAYDDRVRW